MTSNSDSLSGTDPPGPDSSDPSGPSPEEPPTDSAAEVTKCPSCGHEFEGTYCPDCGQKADQSVAVTDIVGDFARDLVDVEGGFGATFIELTLRPAEVLKRYLRGARVELVSPGRYLLASVVIAYGVQLALVWTGALQTPEAYLEPDSISEVDKPLIKAYRESAPQLYQSQWFGIGMTLVTACLFALILRRLLSDEMDSGAEAFAGSAFLVGHATVLGTGGTLLLVPLLFLTTGKPATIPTQSAVGLLVTISYIGVAIYRFRSAWKDAAKAVLGVTWVYVELIAATNLTGLAYALWTVVSSGSLSLSETGFVGAMSAALFVPFLLHAGVEAYYRLR